METLVESEREHLATTSSQKNISNALDVNDSYNNFLAGDGDSQIDISGVPIEVDPTHTRLAMEYIDEVLKLVAKGEIPSKSHPGKESGSLGAGRRRLMKFLKASSSRYDYSRN